jgi:predicted metal-dependent peptidase
MLRAEGKRDGKGGGEGQGSGQGHGQGQGQGNQAGKAGGGGGSDKEEETPDAKANGIGGVISTDESAQIQKELGVPVELPSKKESEQIINEALAQKKHIKGSTGRGTGKGLLQRALDRFAKPQVNWKNELRRIIGKMLSKDEEYFGKKKYLHRDEYIYGDRPNERELKSAIMPVDTSGSMGDDELRLILGEVYGIIRSKKIRRTEVVYFDHGIQGHDIVKNPPRFDWSKAKGGGGTSFVEPMALIAKEYKAGKLELAVFCTDGYGDQETLTSKVKFDKRFVWLIINNPGFKAPFGKVVHITTKNSK